jgi:transcription elongation factor GreB
MSKAFTSEETEPEPILRRSASPLRPGEVRYVTPEGFASLQRELSELTTVERPRAVATGEVSGIDHRIALLNDLLPRLTVLAPREDEGRVVFGSWVTLEDEDGAVKTYRLVGPDEVDPAAGHISVDSPLGRALLGHRAGDEIEVVRPKGVAIFSLTRVSITEK